jgi:hypothetical protein
MGSPLYPFTFDKSPADVADKLRRIEGNLAADRRALHGWVKFDSPMRARQLARLRVCIDRDERYRRNGLTKLRDLEELNGRALDRAISTMGSDDIEAVLAARKLVSA